jgi:D-alanyl-D-alanine carboxypeptidase
VSAPVKAQVLIAIMLAAFGMAVMPLKAGPSLLFEPATGKVISQDRAGMPWYPASLTKLMTA